MRNIFNTTNTLTLCTAILCAGSLVCSVLLFYQLPATPLMAWLFGGFALALEGCKYSFLHIGFSLTRSGQQASGVVVLVLAVVLVALSLVASISFLQQGNQQGQQQALQQSEQYQSLKRQQQRLESQIDNHQTLANQAGGRFKTLAQQHMAAIAAKELQLIDINERLHGLTPPTRSGVTALLAPLADAAHSSLEQAQLTLHTALAIIIEIAIAAALWLLSPATKNPQRTGTAAPTSQAPPPLNAAAKAVVQQIQQGAPPVVRRFTTGENATSHKNVKAAFSYLLAQRAIKQKTSGQGYERLNDASQNTGSQEQQPDLLDNEKTA